jgi:hypothetical protein
MVKVPAAQFTYAPADNSLTLHADTGALAAQAQAQ